MSDELLARCRSFIDEQSCDEWDDKAIDEDAAKLYEFVQREAASAIRLAAQSPEPVTVKPLVWVDHRPDSFPEPAWSAQTPFGFYNIEEVSASDCPAYVVRLHAHRFVADKDSLDDAKAAAQADYEARIRSALVNAPAVDGALREALEEIESLGCHLRQGGPDPIDLQELSDALEEATSLASEALAASEATKSDGGMEGHADPSSGRSSRASHLSRELEEAGIKPGPSDTRPAEVTVETLHKQIFMRVLDALGGKVTPILMTHEVWTGTQDAARALLDTYKIGAK